jgi:hypothetical protein
MSIFADQIRKDSRLHTRRTDNVAHIKLAMGVAMRGRLMGEASPIADSVRRRILRAAKGRLARNITIERMDTFDIVTEEVEHIDVLCAKLASKPSVSGLTRSFIKRQRRLAEHETLHALRDDGWEVTAREVSEALVTPDRLVMKTFRPHLAG